ncbi:hypothetical protein BDV98DRAFT_586827 [Pterulicium gracile]|uniref:Uncharacterized protein n=1 Tax=Pterulicium gracile TaxID=1884261 RepID=A0A5C3Q1W3_9AGAR|nr:hypothetical protein BDV98DRAFT_586827 [Pterula gracilis]
MHFDVSIHQPCSRILYKVLIARDIVDKGTTQVVALDEAIKRLQNYRDHSHRVVVQHQNYLPAISCLPDDILLLVFRDAMGFKRKPTQFWDLASVCQRWRSLAISTPGFRTNLPLILRAGNCRWKTTERQEKQALLQCRRALIKLERGGGQPVVCNFDLSFYTHTYRSSSICDLLGQLFSSLHSGCSSMAINGGGPPSWDLLYTPKPWVPVYTSRKPSPDVVGPIPILHTLHLNDVHLDSRAPESWTSLTALSLTNCIATAPQVIDLLRVTSNLVELEMYLIDLPAEYTTESRSYRDESATLVIPPTSRDAVLPRLETLTVDFGWGFNKHYHPEPDENVILVALARIRCPRVSTVFITSPHVIDIDNGGNSVSANSVIVNEDEGRSEYEDVDEDPGDANGCASGNGAGEDDAGENDDDEDDNRDSEEDDHEDRQSDSEDDDIEDDDIQAL